MLRLLALVIVSSIASCTVTDINYCIPYDYSLGLVRKCTEVMSEANTTDLSFKCVSAASRSACMRKIFDGGAHLVSLNGGDLYTAWQTYSMLPIVSEDSVGSSSFAYYGVAFVNKDFCLENGTSSLELLRNKNACFTSYRGEMVGWAAPIATLLQQGLAYMGNENSAVTADAETAAGFFDKICAPSDYGPLNSNGEQVEWEKLCTACKSGGGCGSSSDYSGYSGAFRCLMEGAGDIAFTKHTVIDDFALGGDEEEFWATKSADDFMLLCPDGGCKTVDEYDTCYWAKAPPPAMAGPWNWNADDVDGIGKKVKDALVEKSKDEQWIRSLHRLDEVEGIILGDDTTTLKPVNATSLAQYMDQTTFSALQVMYYLQRPARFCVTDEVQLALCNNITAMIAEYDREVEMGGGFTWGCVQMYDIDSCMAALADNRAEMLLVDGLELYTARTQYALSPLVKESKSDDEEDDQDTKYYSVAVVNKDFCEKNGTAASLFDLRGKSSCHTGYRDSAGWWMPLATLSKLHLMAKEDREQDVSIDAQSMAEYFDKVCAIGTSTDGPYSDYSIAKEWEPLCSACKSSCSSDDAYYGDVGAFRCLMEGSGDVGFTKHTIPLTADNKQLGLNWNGKSIEDFRLLCPNGGCKRVDEYKECNLGSIPSHTIAVNHALKHSSELQEFLLRASEDSDFSWKIFDGEYGAFWGGEETTTLLSVDVGAQEYLEGAWEQYEELHSQGYGGGLSLPEYFGRLTHICIPMTVDNASLAACSKKFKSTNDVFSEVSFQCVSGGSPVGCMTMVAAGQADWVMLEPRDQNYAITNYGLQPVITEDYGLGYGAGFAVVVVKSEFCDSNSNTSFRQLQGKNACFSGYDKFAGWQLPLGSLAAHNIMDTVAQQNSEVQPDAQSAVAFFGSVCAPGKSYNGPVFTEDGSVDYWDELCKGCKNVQCANDGDGVVEDNAAEDDSTLKASMKCLTEGADVTFTNHLAVEMFSKDGSSPQSWSALNIKDIRLLCPPDYGGGCRPFSEVESCNMGVVPPRAIMTRASETIQWSPAVYAVTNKADADKEWFDSVKRVGDYQMFSNDTVNLAIISDYEYYWGTLTLQNLEAAQQISRPNVTFCVASQQAYEFCEEVKGVMNSVQSHVSFDCYTSGSTGNDCPTAIANKDADFAMLDSYDVYSAMERYKLQPIAAEEYIAEQESDSFAGYASVAVVRKEFCDSKNNVSLRDLKGKNVCSTGYRRTAGFVIPVGYLLVNKIMPFVSNDDMIQNDAESVGGFFEHVCAARVVHNGPQMTADGKGDEWEKMCTACGESCTEDDEYYDFAGSIRCLMEGNGDVAFTKHEAPLDFAKDGDKEQSWSTLNKEDMRLLCPNGACAAVDDWQNCKFTDVPAHAAVTRADFLHAGHLRKALAEIVVNDEIRRLVLNDTANPLDHLFSTGIVIMKPIFSTEKYFGNAYRLFKGFAALEEDATAAG